MEALGIIEAFDVIEDGGACLVVVGELATIDQFPFEGAPEAFHGGIVVTVALAAHGGHQHGGLECVAEVATGILDAAIGMEQQFGGWLPGNKAMLKAAVTRAVSMRSLMAQPTILRL